MEITFPTTAEAFIAYQEAGTGRNFNIHEKELMEKSVEILNESYERGKTGERMPFPESEELRAKCYQIWERTTIGSGHL